MHYKEHDEITIPEWLAGWEDFSWHNDAMPHSILFLRGEEGANVEVWVNYPEPAEREIGARYEVVYRTRDDLETGADETLYMGEDENQARQWAEAAREARGRLAEGDAAEPVSAHVARILELNREVGEMKPVRAFTEDLNPTARQIFDAVVAAMQDAEEIWGPGDEGYVPLMRAIAAEADERVANFTRKHANRQAEVGK